MKLARFLAAVPLVALALACRAQGSYPNKPVRILIPYAAGGGVDAAARQVAKGLGDALGQSFVVEPRPGGNTVIATDAVARSAPDGYTLLLCGGSTMALLPFTQAKLPFDPLVDFAPVGQLSRAPYFIAVSASKPYKTAKDLFDDARRAGGAMAYASNGIGSMSHLGAEMSMQRAGVKMVHVPYNGFVPAIADLVTGRVVMMMTDLGPVNAQVKGGGLNLLAVASPKRSAFAPDVPTLAEAGLGGAEVEVWLGLYAPAKTPRDILTRLSTELAKVMASPAVREELAKVGQEADYADPDATRQRIQVEQKAFSAAAKTANLVAKD